MNLVRVRRHALVSYTSCEEDGLTVGIFYATMFTIYPLLRFRKNTNVLIRFDSFLSLSVSGDLCLLCFRFQPV